MIGYQLEHLNITWGKDAERFPQFYQISKNKTENCKAVQ